MRPCGHDYQHLVFISNSDITKSDRAVVPRLFLTNLVKSENHHRAIVPGLASGCFTRVESHLVVHHLHDPRNTSSPSRDSIRRAPLQWSADRTACFGDMSIVVYTHCCLTMLLLSRWQSSLSSDSCASQGVVLSIGHKIPSNLDAHFMSFHHDPRLLTRLRRPCSSAEL